MRVLLDLSTVASIEGAHAKKHGKMVTLSEQNLVDCQEGPAAVDAEDCCDDDDALMDNAFDYIINKQKGVLIRRRIRTGRGRNANSRAVRTVRKSRTGRRAFGRRDSLRCTATVGPGGARAASQWQATPAMLTL